MGKRLFRSSTAIHLIILLLLLVIHTDDAQAQYQPRQEDLPGDSTGETILKGVLIGAAVIAVIVIISKVSKSSDDEAEESDSTATTMLLKEAEYYSMNDITQSSKFEGREVSRVNIYTRRIDPICVLRRDEFIFGIRVLF